MKVESNKKNLNKIRIFSIVIKCLYIIIFGGLGVWTVFEMTSNIQRDVFVVVIMLGYVGIQTTVNKHIKEEYERILIFKEHMEEVENEIGFIESQEGVILI